MSNAHDRVMDISVPREQVLVYGLVDWVELGFVHWRVREANPDAPLAQLQDATLRLVGELVEDELFEVGDLTGDGDTFSKWPWPLEVSLQRIREQYVDDYDRDMWDFVCWLNLTEKGESAAQLIQERAEPPVILGHVLQPPGGRRGYCRGRVGKPAVTVGHLDHQAIRSPG